MNNLNITEQVCDKKKKEYVAPELVVTIFQTLNIMTDSDEPFAMDDDIFPNP